MEQCSHQKWMSNFFYWKVFAHKDAYAHTWACGWYDSYATFSFRLFSYWVWIMKCRNIQKEDKVKILMFSVTACRKFRLQTIWKPPVSLDSQTGCEWLLEVASWCFEISCWSPIHTGQQTNKWIPSNYGSQGKVVYPRPVNEWFLVAVVKRDTAALKTSWQLVRSLWKEFTEV